ncbi:MAG: hypothetical protein HKN41_12260, partial [Ilumatobacter sp.]|nr:hypothetical protein [Ilumatobacter sp.]
WLSRSFSLGLGRWKAIVIATALTSGLGGMLAIAGLAYLFDDVVIFDDEVVGWSSDRLPLAGVLVTVGVVLTVVGTLASVALMLRTVDGDERGGALGAEATAAWWAIRRGLAVMPRAIGWGLVLTLGFAAAVLVLVLVTVVVLPLGILLIVAAVPAFVFVAVRLAFTVQAIVDRPGNPFRRSFEVSRGRFWATFGRMLLLGLIVWLVSLVVQTVSGLLSGSGFQGFGQDGLVTEDDGTFVSMEMGETFATSPWALVVTVVSTVVVALFTGGVVGAGSAMLYRSRNAAEEPFA